MQFYNDYGDIIKATLGKAREINKVQTAKTLAASLTQLYRELQEEQRVVDHSSESFLSIKVVTRMFSLALALERYCLFIGLLSFIDVTDAFAQLVLAVISIEK